MPEPLEQYEIVHAVVCGVMRTTKSRQDTRERKNTSKRDLNLLTDINAAGAEVFAAKKLNRYWHASVDVFHGLPDVGAHTEVRHTEREDGSLIVRPDDGDDKFFVLITGNIADGYTLRGWIRGADAKRPEWKRAPNNDREVYWVPQSALSMKGLDSTN